MKRKRLAIRRWFGYGCLIPVALLVFLVLLSAISNTGLAQHSTVVDHLSDEEKARLAETIQLHKTLGDQAWPGFGSADIPFIVYNEAYAFLVGLPNPADGWVKVPQGWHRGGSWELVPGDEFEGQRYYRQQLKNGVTPEGFAVLVGDRWVASMGTYEWLQISLRAPIEKDLPAFLRPVFPYRLFVGSLLGTTDKWSSLMLHEAFHAYQGLQVESYLASAERALSASESQYPWEEPASVAAWQKELDLLAEALQAPSSSEAAELARQFLSTRRDRRESLSLSPQLEELERQREWLEGLARYLELEIWRVAVEDPQYQPHPLTEQLSNFDSYGGYANRWSQEVSQLRRVADSGETRFYYSGMAQARLLDELLPGWKDRIMEADASLEALLAEAVK